MIEARDILHILCDVTVFTLPTAKDAGRMGVLVTCYAARYLYGPKFAFTKMTFVALLVLVLTGQLKISFFAMVKGKGRLDALPIARFMAILTFGQIRFLSVSMIFTVAAIAGRFCTQVARSFGSWSTCCVAFSTFHIGV